MNKTRWGIDMGGTKIECVVLGPDNEILFRDRVPTESSLGYEHILQQIQKITLKAEKETGITTDTIGMCTPGSIDEESGLLKNSNTVVLNHQPFQKDIERLLKKEVFIENDANCFALAEHVMGSVAEYHPEAKVSFGVIMGTGVGGGVVVNSKLISGLNHIGGEWGHNYLDSSGGPCYCGKVGCVEKVISGTALQDFYHQKSGQRRKLKEILTLARAKADQVAEETLDRLIHFFGIGLSVVINILDPDVIVIGGGVGNIDELYTRGAESVKKYVFNPNCKTPIIRPKLGDSAGVFGAAFLQD